MSKRIPPVFYCPFCEVGVKIEGLRGGGGASRPQYIEKKCTECATAESSALTGVDRNADPLRNL